MATTSLETKLSSVPAFLGAATPSQKAYCSALLQTLRQKRTDVHAIGLPADDDGVRSLAMGVATVCCRLQGKKVGVCLSSAGQSRRVADAIVKMIIDDKSVSVARHSRTIIRVCHVRGGLCQLCNTVQFIEPKSAKGFAVSDAIFVQKGSSACQTMELVAAAFCLKEPPVLVAQPKMIEESEAEWTKAAQSKLEGKN